MNAILEFSKCDFEWSHHDTQTDSLKFYLESDTTLTEDEYKRIIDTMLNAGNKVLSDIIKHENNKS